MTYLISDIEKAVCRRYQLTRDDMQSRSRRRAISRPRQIVMYLCRDMTKASFPKIGRHLGGRDHTTVIHGQRRIAQLLRETNSMACEVEGCREILLKMPTLEARASAPLVEMRA